MRVTGVLSLFRAGRRRPIAMADRPLCPGREEPLGVHQRPPGHQSRVPRHARRHLRPARVRRGGRPDSDTLRSPTADPVRIADPRIPTTDPSAPDRGSLRIADRADPSASPTPDPSASPTADPSASPTPTLPAADPDPSASPDPSRITGPDARPSASRPRWPSPPSRPGPTTRAGSSGSPWRSVASGMSAAPWDPARSTARASCGTPTAARASRAASAAGTRHARCSRWARVHHLASRSNPRVGDVVIYGGGTHAGIYIGHGRVISALNPRQGIRVTRLHALARAVHHVHPHAHLDAAPWPAAGVDEADGMKVLGDRCPVSDRGAIPLARRTGREMSGRRRLRTAPTWLANDAAAPPKEAPRLPLVQRPGDGRQDRAPRHRAPRRCPSRTRGCR